MLALCENSQRPQDGLRCLAVSTLRRFNPLAGDRSSRVSAAAGVSWRSLRLLDFDPSPLLAEMRQGAAQWRAGDAHQPLEGRVHRQNQEDRT